MLGAPSISDENEFGIPRVPIYITMRDGLIAGACALSVGAVFALLDWYFTGLLVMIAIFTGMSFVFMQLREKYGQAWVFNLLMRLGLKGDEFGLLGPSGGQVRRLGPVAQPGFTGFRGSKRDLGQIDPSQTLFAPLGFSPAIPRARCVLNAVPQGLATRMAAGQQAGIVRGVIYDR